jgi:hypothetical protein
MRRDGECRTLLLIFHNLLTNYFDEILLCSLISCHQDVTSPLQIISFCSFSTKRHEVDLSVTRKRCKFEILGKTAAVNALILGIPVKVLCFIVEHGLNSSLWFHISAILYTKRELVKKLIYTHSCDFFNIKFHVSAYCRSRIIVIKSKATFFFLDAIFLFCICRKSSPDGS